MGDFVYTWSGPGAFTSTSTSISPTVAGTYTAVYAGCSATYVVAATDISCCRAYYLNNTTDPTVYQNVVIGNPNTLTTLSGDHVFDGIYHIIEPLKFSAGIFTLRQGTKFYMDGQVAYSDPVCPNFGNFTPSLTLNFLQVDDGATLNLVRATITAACDHMWEGIRLTGNSRIIGSPASGAFRTQISDALCGIKSYSNIGCDQYNQNYFYLEETDFFRCKTGIIDYNKKIAVPGEGLKLCHFTANNLKAPFFNQRADFGVYLYKSPNLPLEGDYQQAVFYNNTFRYFRVTGFAGMAGNVTLERNYFDGCVNNAIDVGHSTVHGYRTWIINNQIHYSSATSPSIGIRAHPNTEIYDNKIYGTWVASTAPLSNSIGILCVGELTYVGRNGYPPNLIRNVEQGIRTEFKAGNNLISNNQFQNNVKNIVIAPSGPSWPTTQRVDILCNTFENTATPMNAYSVKGIEIMAGSGLANQGSCGGTLPVTGNKFVFTSTTTMDLESATGNFPTNYNHGTNELPLSFTGPISLSNCGTSSNCMSMGFLMGVNRVAGTDSLAIAEMMDSLRLQVGNPQDLSYYEHKIIDYHKSNSYISELLAYANTLPATNIAAYNTITINLMRHYRSSGNEAAAQTLRDQLLANNPGNVEIDYEVMFFDLQGRLGNLLLGNAVSLTTQDSTELADIASSGTVHWLEACHAIRNFHPSIVCNNGYNYRQQQQAAKAAIALGNAYPNPAESAVTIPYTLPKGTSKAMLQIAEVATGRLVNQVNLNLESEQLEVSIANLKPGSYTYTLMLDGTPAGTKKLVVIK
ncbi:MAG: right-handed parallel beta-helix repeat-containing protein [Sphingobacteriales bacterium]|nr:MAG: right-handed parallel beta-helix repeat-containing protein [Sphingobacteriales bacterium]